ncbi:MAG: hypothetical protein ACK41C_05430 [Phenylobacterium sp.]|uniref:hypothetical protein n=1 Tax=Phenylobacterium sp. TaxID=1871053 RepID=UPI0039198F3B
MRRLLPISLLAALAGSGMGVGAAAAQPVCRAPAPAVGAVLRGPVLHVPDGETLCLALGAEPAQWVELRLQAPSLHRASAGPSSRGTLMAAAFAKDALCEIVASADGAPVAACEIEGRPLTELLDRPQVQAAAHAWR